MDKLDAVTIEVIRSALPAIANEMAADMQRTSYNMMIYEVKDFCTTLVNPKGELVAQNMGGVSQFVADLGVIVEDAMKRFGAEGFQPGDVIITNHQAVAGQHLNNVVVYTPFFFKGELVMFTMTRAHWIDVGGTSTGFGGGADNPWLEGLQLDQLKIYEAGEPNEALLRVIRNNIRFPESSFGDMRSQIAACHLAQQRLEELYERFGKEVMTQAIERIFQESETKCRLVVETIPDGVYESEATYLQGPARIRCHALVTISGGDMTIDLSGCSGEQQLAINSRTYAAAKVAYKALTTPFEPVNEGGFRALNAIIPEGNIMMARFPAPMSNWSSILPLVVDTVLQAVAPAIPERIPAGHHGTLGSVVVFFGRDPETGKGFVTQSIEGGGWGGGPYGDGESGSVSICQGDVSNSPIESMELKWPIMVEERSLRPDSGGPGRNRGGLGIAVKVRNFTPGTWLVGGGKPARLESPPWGILGGKNGDTPFNLVKLAGEPDFRPPDPPGPPGSARSTFPPDSSALILSSGGGGWGDPFEREPERVRDDVADGWVSLEAAERDYGVVLDPKTLEIDVDATTRLRARGQRAAAE